MLAILIIAASTVPAAAPAAPAASPATPSVQCRVTVDTVGHGYQVRCPAMPIPPIDARARAEGAPVRGDNPSRGR